MIKKLLALAAGAVFSMNASASYTQYTLNGPVSGFFIQNDTDRSIGFYDLWVNAPYVYSHFSASGNFDNLTGASYKSDNVGPTSFGAYDALTEVYFKSIKLDFYSDASNEFTYAATYSQTQVPWYPSWGDKLHPLTTWYGGSAVASPASEQFTQMLDSYRQYGLYPDGIPVIIPTRDHTDVPEPMSLGLIAIGAIGFGAARRRKT